MEVVGTRLSRAVHGFDCNGFQNSRSSGAGDYAILTEHWPVRLSTEQKEGGKLLTYNLVIMLCTSISVGLSIA